jgi:glucose/arabinose dehydrogenase
MKTLIKKLAILVVLQFITVASFASKNLQAKLVPLLTKQKVIWGFDFINQNQIIFTTRNGEIYLFTIDTQKSSPLEVPEILKQSLFTSGQGGLLDIRISPDFSKNNLIYITYSKKIETKAATTLAQFKLVNGVIKDFKDLLVTKSISKNSIHFGSRIEFKSANEIYISVGDRNERDQAQKLDNHMGKILRLDSEGKALKDNPFIDDKKALSEIYSLGHRNPQGLAINKSDNSLWSSEFGPRGGDEVNLIESGKNYGWPIVTFGKEYWGPKISDKTSQPGMIDPVTQWTPSISPSGITFYSGKSFNDCSNCLVIGNLSGQHIRLLKINPKKATEQKEHFTDSGIRFRNVRAGLDGFLYYSTDSGELGRVEQK